MKHVITCSNVKCKFNDGYSHCEIKTIGVTQDGKCATFVPVNNNQRILYTNPMDEHTNMC